MEANLVIIPARSKRQAMDWSLVLASQDIETTIECSTEGAGWGLVVDAGESERAMAAIHQFRLENRGLAWRQKLEWSGLTFHWGSIVWCLFLCLFYFWNVVWENGPRLAGTVDSIAVSAGEWWRLFTAVTLHLDLGHLAANATTGFLVFGLAMARYGSGIALLAAYLAGVGGNLAGLLLYTHHYRGLGASGMVMGGIGLLAVQSLSLWRESPKTAKFIFSGVMAGIMLLVLFGLDPKTDVIAHVGGFVGGSLIGAALAFIPVAHLQKPSTNLAAGILLGVMIVGTWFLALR